MDESGKYTLMGISEDGTWATVAAGNTMMGGTWSMDGGKPVFVSASDNTDQKIELKNGKLIFTIDDKNSFTFKKISSDVPTEEDYVGVWNLDGWDGSAAGIRALYETATFSDGGKCSLDTDLDFMACTGTWRVDSGICRYTFKYSKGDDRYTGAFTGSEFVLADSPYCFKKS